MSSEPCDEFKNKTDDFVAWVAHVNNGCQQCLELARYLSVNRR
jgi:hypothetical protein